MRMQGKSYTEISHGLGVAKSTLSGWFQHLEISEEARKKIQAKARNASLASLLNINKRQTQLAQQRMRIARLKAAKEIGKLTKQELLLVGISLYWAEGYKRPVFRNGKARTYHPISFTNSDPAMVKLFLRFLRQVCGVSDDRLIADLRIFEHQSEAQLIDHWSKITQIPFENFKKVYRTSNTVNQRKRSYNILPYGTLQIRVNDTALFHTIMGWIEGISNIV